MFHLSLDNSRSNYMQKRNMGRKNRGIALMDRGKVSEDRLEATEVRGVWPISPVKGATIPHIGYNIG
ncbi:MAG: hypothetical protein NVS4B11_22090 [Ktedonobacteraceae bacterium]